MSIKIVQSEINPGYSIIKLDRKFDTIAAELVEEKLKKLYSENKNDIIIDFKDSNYLSSMGLRVLFSASRYLNEYNKKLILINVGQTVIKVIKIADCSSLFDIHTGEETPFQK